MACPTSGCCVANPTGAGLLKTKDFAMTQHAVSDIMCLRAIPNFN